VERDWGGYVAEKELDGRDGGVDGESSDRWGGVRVMCEVSGGWRWDEESPHILAGSFRANENECRVSMGKNGKCGGGEEARTRELEEWGDDKKRMR
jgi:hypothetical protein